MSADPVPVKLDPIEGIKVHYIKSTHFRVLYVEGAYGGITPHGLIEFAVYNERRPIPRTGVIHVTKNTAGAAVPTVSEEVIEGRDGIVREVESAILMTAENAARLAEWLTTKVDELAKVKATIDAK